MQFDRKLLRGEIFPVDESVVVRLIRRVRRDEAGETETERMRERERERERERVDEEEREDDNVGQRNEETGGRGRAHHSRPHDLTRRGRVDGCECNCLIGETAPGACIDKTVRGETHPSPMAGLLRCGLAGTFRS